MRRIRCPLGYLILHGGQILHANPREERQKRQSACVATGTGPGYLTGAPERRSGLSLPDLVP